MHVKNEKLRNSAFTCIRQPKDTAWSAVSSVLRFLTWLSSYLSYWVYRGSVRDSPRSCEPWISEYYLYVPVAPGENCSIPPHYLTNSVEVVSTPISTTFVIISFLAKSRKMQQVSEIWDHRFLKKHRTVQRKRRQVPFSVFLFQGNQSATPLFDPVWAEFPRTCALK